MAAARRTSDGALGGYSLVYLPRGEAAANQDDTLVMPEHRGHRLGLALKRATLGVLAREHPELTAIHTWTAVDNVPMQRTSLEFGYRRVERMHEMQGRITPMPEWYDALPPRGEVAPEHWATDAFRDELRAWCESWVRCQPSLSDEELADWGSAAASWLGTLLEQPSVGRVGEA